MKAPDDKMLESLFATARDQDVTPSNDLLARVLADAAPVTTVPLAAQTASSSLWSHLLSLVGGWPALSGVAAAGIAGLWVGLTPPDAVDGWVADMLGTSTAISFVDDFSAFDEGTIDG